MMEYRILGKTGLRVSALGIGTWQLSGPITIDGKPDGFPDIGKAEAKNLISACSEMGLNVIDSGEIYGLEGEGERRIGEALKGKRDQWIISTKFGLRRSPEGHRINDCSPQTIRSSLEGSLRRLQTDYVDIYLYHISPDSDSLAAGREVLDALKQEGKIRFYGISTDQPEVLQTLIHHDAVDVVQFNQSLLTDAQFIIDQVKQYHLGSMIRGAFNYGLLSGRYFEQRPQLSDLDIRHVWFNQLKTERYRAYQAFVPPGYLMSALALRYLLDLPTTHTIILGGKSIQDYQEALRAFELAPLSQQTRQALANLKQQLEKPSLQRQVVNTLKQLVLSSR